MTDMEDIENDLLSSASTSGRGSRLLREDLVATALTPVTSCEGMDLASPASVASVIDIPTTPVRTPSGEEERILGHLKDRLNPSEVNQGLVDLLHQQVAGSHLSPARKTVQAMEKGTPSRTKSRAAQYVDVAAAQQTVALVADLLAISDDYKFATSEKAAREAVTKAVTLNDEGILSIDANAMAICRLEESRVYQLRALPASPTYLALLDKYFDGVSSPRKHRREAHRLFESLELAAKAKDDEPYVLGSKALRFPVCHLDHIKGIHAGVSLDTLKNPFVNTMTNVMAGRNPRTRPPFCWKTAFPEEIVSEAVENISAAGMKHHLSGQSWVHGVWNFSEVPGVGFIAQVIPKDGLEATTVMPVLRVVTASEIEDIVASREKNVYLFSVPPQTEKEKRRGIYTPIVYPVRRLKLLAAEKVKAGAITASKTLPDGRKSMLVNIAEYLPCFASEDEKAKDVFELPKGKAKGGGKGKHRERRAYREKVEAMAAAGDDGQEFFEKRKGKKKSKGKAKSKVEVLVAPAAVALKSKSREKGRFKPEDKLPWVLVEVIDYNVEGSGRK